MSNRKLLSEIDRTLKKVTEGVEIFEEIFDKLYAATTSNQKEKFEQDLKKEIKKLQRMRDQIKVWISSSEIKDKNSLIESRKVIEQQMERFKTCEREMKTKAYSKEGLNAAVKVDPKEKEKAEFVMWINSCVDKLNTQVDAFEAEIEAMHLNVKKNKKLDSEKDQRVKELEKKVERHKFHQMKLELILRCVENGVIATELAVTIKDDVEYYIENHEEDDQIEDETFYEGLNLEEEESHFFSGSDEHGGEEVISPTVSATSSSVPPPPQSVPIPLKKAKKPSPTTSLSSSTVAPAPIVVPPVKEKKPSYSAVSAVPTSVPPPVNPTPKVWNKLVPASVIIGGSNVQSTSNTVPNNTPAASVSVTTNATPVSPNPPEALSMTSTTANHPSFLLEYFSTVRNNLSDLTAVQNLVDTSFQHIPDASDADRPKHYSPKNPFNTPKYYPAAPLPIFENPVLFEKFEIDTLFFIFYYQQRSYQQYLSARELKRQSWRFHKKYLTWFQRHEEPKAITDDYEQGTYIYFDYEGAWCQRKKSDFTFEYRYLEDAELV